MQQGHAEDLMFFFQCRWICFAKTTCHHRPVQRMVPTLQYDPHAVCFHRFLTAQLKRMFIDAWIRGMSFSISLGLCPWWGASVPETQTGKILVLSFWRHLVAKDYLSATTIRVCHSIENISFVFPFFKPTFYDGRWWQAKYTNFYLDFFKFNEDEAACRESAALCVCLPSYPYSSSCGSCWCHAIYN